MADPFRELLDGLRRHGQLYIHPFNVDTLIAYFSGYDLASRHAGLQSPLEGMRELVYLRYGREIGSEWPLVIRRYFAKSEKEAIKRMFEFVDDLLEIRNEQGLDYLYAEFGKMSQLKRKRATNIRWPKPEIV
jgi:hypothetical protein